MALLVKMKKIIISLVWAFVMIAVSFAIMGQYHSLLHRHTWRPLVLVAHLGVALVWFFLAISANFVWWRKSLLWIRSAHFGLCVSTIIMVVFYRWAQECISAGFPLQVCSNYFDSGGRDWYVLGVIVDFLFWAAVFAGGYAAAVITRRKRTEMVK